MKYLKYFKSFENLEVSIKDEPDVKIAKEEANDLEQNLNSHQNELDFQVFQG